MEDFRYEKVAQLYKSAESFFNQQSYEESESVCKQALSLLYSQSQSEDIRDTVKTARNIFFFDVFVLLSFCKWKTRSYAESLFFLTNVDINFVQYLISAQASFFVHNLPCDSVVLSFFLAASVISKEAIVEQHKKDIYCTDLLKYHKYCLEMCMNYQPNNIDVLSNLTNVYMIMGDIPSLHSTTVKLMSCLQYQRMDIPSEILFLYAYSCKVLNKYPSPAFPLYSLNYTDRNQCQLKKILAQRFKRLEQDKEKKKMMYAHLKPSCTICINDGIPKNVLVYLLDLVKSNLYLLPKIVMKVLSFFFSRMSFVQDYDLKSFPFHHFLKLQLIQSQDTNYEREIHDWIDKIYENIIDNLEPMNSTGSQSFFSSKDKICLEFFVEDSRLDDPFSLNSRCRSRSIKTSKSNSSGLSVESPKMNTYLEKIHKSLTCFFKNSTYFNSLCQPASFFFCDLRKKNNIDSNASRKPVSILQSDFIFPDWKVSLMNFNSIENCTTLNEFMLHVFYLILEHKIFETSPKHVCKLFSFFYPYITCDSHIKFQIAQTLINTSLLLENDLSISYLQIGFHLLETSNYEKVSHVPFLWFLSKTLLLFESKHSSKDCKNSNHTVISQKIEFFSNIKTLLLNCSQSMQDPEDIAYPLRNHINDIILYIEEEESFINIESFTTSDAMHNISSISALQEFYPVFVKIYNSCHSIYITQLEYFNECKSSGISFFILVFQRFLDSTQILVNSFMNLLNPIISYFSMNFDQKNESIDQIIISDDNLESKAKIIRIVLSIYGILIDMIVYSLFVVYNNKNQRFEDFFSTHNKSSKYRPNNKLPHHFNNHLSTLAKNWTHNASTILASLLSFLSVINDHLICNISSEDYKLFDNNNCQIDFIKPIRFCHLSVENNEKPTQTNTIDSDTSDSDMKDVTCDDQSCLDFNCNISALTQKAVSSSVYTVEFNYNLSYVFCAVVKLFFFLNSLLNQIYDSSYQINKQEDSKNKMSMQVKDIISVFQFNLQLLSYIIYIPVETSSFLLSISFVKLKECIECTSFDTFSRYDNLNDSLFLHFSMNDLNNTELLTKLESSLSLNEYLYNMFHFFKASLEFECFKSSLLDITSFNNIYIESFPYKLCNSLETIIPSEDILSYPSWLLEKFEEWNAQNSKESVRSPIQTISDFKNTSEDSLGISESTTILNPCEMTHPKISCSICIKFGKISLSLPKSILTLLLHMQGSQFLNNWRRNIIDEIKKLNLCLNQFENDKNFTGPQWFVNLLEDFDSMDQCRHNLNISMNSENNINFIEILSICFMRLYGLPVYPRNGSCFDQSRLLSSYENALLPFSFINLSPFHIPSLISLYLMLNISLKAYNWFSTNFNNFTNLPKNFKLRLREALEYCFDVYIATSNSDSNCVAKNKSNYYKLCNVENKISYWCISGHNFESFSENDKNKYNSIPMMFDPLSLPLFVYHQYDSDWKKESTINQDISMESFSDKIIILHENLHLNILNGYYLSESDKNNFFKDYCSPVIDSNALYLKQLNGTVINLTHLADVYMNSYPHKANVKGHPIFIHSYAFPLYKSYYFVNLISICRDYQLWVSSLLNQLTYNYKTGNLLKNSIDTHKSIHFKAVSFFVKNLLPAFPIIYCPTYFSCLYDHIIEKFDRLTYYEKQLSKRNSKNIRTEYLTTRPIDMNSLFQPLGIYFNTYFTLQDLIENIVTVSRYISWNGYTLRIISSLSTLYRLMLLLQDDTFINYESLELYPSFTHVPDSSNHEMNFCFPVQFIPTNNLSSDPYMIFNLGSHSLFFLEFENLLFLESIKEKANQTSIESEPYSAFVFDLLEKTINYVPHNDKQEDLNSNNIFNNSVQHSWNTSVANTDSNGTNNLLTTELKCTTDTELFQSNCFFDKTSPLIASNSRLSIFSSLNTPFTMNTDTNDNETLHAHVLSKLNAASRNFYMLPYLCHEDTHDLFGERLTISNQKVNQCSKSAYINVYTKMSNHFIKYQNEGNHDKCSTRDNLKETSSNEGILNEFYDETIKQLINIPQISPLSILELISFYFNSSIEAIIIDFFLIQKSSGIPPATSQIIGSILKTQSYDKHRLCRLSNKKFALQYDVMIGSNFDYSASINRIECFLKKMVILNDQLNCFTNQLFGKNEFSIRKQDYLNHFPSTAYLFSSATWIPSFLLAQGYSIHCKTSLLLQCILINSSKTKNNDKNIEIVETMDVSMKDQATSEMDSFKTDLDNDLDLEHNSKSYIPQSACKFESHNELNTLKNSERIHKCEEPCYEDNFECQRSFINFNVDIQKRFIASLCYYSYSLKKLVNSSHSFFDETALEIEKQKDSIDEKKSASQLGLQFNLTMTVLMDLESLRLFLLYVAQHYTLNNHIYSQIWKIVHFFKRDFLENHCVSYDDVCSFVETVYNLPDSSEFYDYFENLFTESDTNFLQTETETLEYASHLFDQHSETHPSIGYDLLQYYLLTEDINSGKKIINKLHHKGHFRFDSVGESISLKDYQDGFATNGYYIYDHIVCARHRNHHKLHIRVIFLTVYFLELLLMNFFETKEYTDTINEIEYDNKILRVSNLSPENVTKNDESNLLDVESHEITLNNQTITVKSDTLDKSIENIDLYSNDESMNRQIIGVSDSWEISLLQYIEAKGPITLSKPSQYQWIPIVQHQNDELNDFCDIFSLYMNYFININRLNRKFNTSTGVNGTHKSKPITLYTRIYEMLQNIMVHITACIAHFSPELSVVTKTTNNKISNNTSTPYTRRRIDIRLFLQLSSSLTILSENHKKKISKELTKIGLSLSVVNPHFITLNSSLIEKKNTSDDKISTTVAALFELKSSSTIPFPIALLCDIQDNRTLNIQEPLYYYSINEHTLSSIIKSLNNKVTLKKQVQTKDNFYKK